jgi:predicted TPR repeat methyltransferase
MVITEDNVASKTLLNAAYNIENKDDAKRLYDDWAAGYADEMAANGYAAPARTADALAKYAADKAAPVLDLGCGAGLSGAALGDAGFSTVDGADFAPRMLKAAAERGVYRDLVLTDLSDPLPGAPDQYANMCAVGVFSPGHAPASLIAKVMNALPRGGCFAFTLNEHAMKDAEYGCWMRELLDTGYASLLFKELGPHVPGIGLQAEVWVIRRS